MLVIIPYITRHRKNIQHSTSQNTETPTTLSISVTLSRLNININADLVFAFLESFIHLTPRSTTREANVKLRTVALMSL